MGRGAMARAGRSARVALFLASRAIRRGNLGVTVMTILVLLLIYCDLLFVPSLIQGAVDKIELQLVETLTGDIQIVPAHGDRDIADVGAYLADIRATGGVAAATATYRIGTEIGHGDESNVWSVDAIDPESYAAVFRTPSDLAEGTALDPVGEAQILLGMQIAGAGNGRLRGYATSLKTVHAGDDVAVRLTTGRSVTAHVEGIFDNQFYLSDLKAYVTQRWAEELLPAIHDRATVIYVRAAPGSDADRILGRLGELRPNVSLHTSAEIGGPIKDEVETFDLINEILRTITLFVALATIFIVTYVDLVGRRRQIGIERAIGITPAALILSYVFKAIAYAVVAIGLGCLAFLFVVVPIVARHPFQFPFGAAALGVRADELWRNAAILTVVAAISASIPAWRSVRMRILDAIWST
jgi:putative ABC transport system permease protein